MDNTGEIPEGDFRWRIRTFEVRFLAEHSVAEVPAEWLRKAWEKLNARERYVFITRTDYPRKTLKALGVELDLSMRRIRQIEMKAYRKIRLYAVWEEKIKPPQPTPVIRNPDSVDLDQLIFPTLNLTFRTEKALNRAGIKTLRQLVTRTEQDLLKLKNFGRKSLTNVKVELAFYHLVLRD